MAKDAIEGMTARKAIVKNVGLYKDEYAAAILGKQGKQVVGYVLTHSDDMVFAIKLEYIDAIEGYNEYMASQGLYQRDAVDAIILDEQGKETTEIVRTWIYHRKGISEAEEIPEGDWLKREKDSKQSSDKEQIE